MQFVPSDSSTGYDPCLWIVTTYSVISKLAKHVFSGFHTFQIEAGQFCTFLIHNDSSVSACGKGSYGRLGLGDSNNQPFPTKLVFEPKHGIKKISSSKGSDGHTLALSLEGEVFSWGDGKLTPTCGCSWTRVQSPKDKCWLGTCVKHFYLLASKQELVCKLSLSVC